MRKLGMNYGAERPEGLSDEARLARLAEYGFGAIFTGIGKPETIDALAPKVRAAGIDYDFIHAPFDGINRMWKEGEAGEEMLERLIVTAETCARNEIEYRIGRVATASKTAKSGHSRVVPTVYKPCFHELTEVSFRHYGVSYVKSCKFSLLGLDFKSDVLDNPLVKRTVVFKLY